jgi:hypothetical protein
VSDDGDVTKVGHLIYDLDYGNFVILDLLLKKGGATYETKTNCQTRV